MIFLRKLLLIKEEPPVMNFTMLALTGLIFSSLRGILLWVKMRPLKSSETWLILGQETMIELIKRDEMPVNFLRASSRMMCFRLDIKS